MTKPTQVVVKEQTAVSTVVAPNLGAGDEEILQSDILIPKLLLMQGLSDLVNARKANQGDMVRSTTAEVLGAPDKPVEFIPLTFYNQWVLNELEGNKYVYKGTEPMTAKNQDLPWEYEKLGSNGAKIKCKRIKSLNVYALLPKDIKREKEALELAKKQGRFPDPNSAVMPVLISFRSTSYSAGKAIATHFALAKKLNSRAYVSTFKLLANQEKNDLGSYYVFKVEPTEGTPNDEQVVCEEWYGVVKAGQHKVDDSDLVQGESLGKGSSFPKEAAY